MTTTDDQTHRVPVLIAPAPARRAESASLDNEGTLSQSSMLYTCKTCAKRKVKCDKVKPVCSACRKGKLECNYQAPLPRSRKRKLDDDVLERLARYECILQQHGLLDETLPYTTEEAPREPATHNLSESELPASGKLLTGQGKSRYIESNIWQNLGDDEMQHLSDGEEENQIVTGNSISADPLTGTFMGCQQSILDYHPTHVDAMALWRVHVENVQPICKVLHIPSTSKMVEFTSRQPELASKADECILFAIYHTAIVSLTNEECSTQFGQSRSTLMEWYYFATRQALVNASFVKTTQMSVLQAFFLFLLSSRHYYDSHTYWILTGIALRISQRMGLHTDCEKLGLPPFDVEMRRRLFIQIYPLDSRASQVCGTNMTPVPGSWDIQLPLNINDEQIWPGMLAKPLEQKGATDMVFCLSRACLGRFLARAGAPVNGGGSWKFKECLEAEQLISAAENAVEEKFIRYCDIVNPLHFLTIGLARSQAAALRLRIQLPKIRNQTASDTERKELFQLAQKVLETDAAVHAHAGLRKYQWHIRPFLLWGAWDSLILVLTTIWKRRDLLSISETEAAWKSILQIYHNHNELLDSRKALHMALGRLALKTWDAHQSGPGIPDPAFINTLRSRQGSVSETGDTPSFGPLPMSAVNALFGGLSDSMGFDVNHKSGVVAEDWVCWDQLIKDYQFQDTQ